MIGRLLLSAVDAAVDVATDLLEMGLSVCGGWTMLRGAAGTYPDDGTNPFEPFVNDGPGAFTVWPTTGVPVAWDEFGEPPTDEQWERLAAIGRHDISDPCGRCCWPEDCVSGCIKSEESVRG